MAVAFVAAGTVYTATGGSTSITLNAPAGLASGHTMVALVAFWANGSQRTVTCTGWTVQQTAFRDTGSDELQLVMLTRVAGGSEPSSWTATVSGTVYLRVAAVAAYSGVQSLGASGETDVAGATSLATSTVNNDTTGSWRVVLGAYFSGSASYTISSNETSRRFLATADNSGAVQAALWDSNTGLATGNTSRTVSRSATWTSAGSCILLLEPSTGTPATGTWSSTLAKVEADGDGEIHNDAVVDVELPAVGFEGDGYGQPPEGEAVVDAALPAVHADMEGGTEVQATLDAVVAVRADVVAETRAFGVRVIVVEADDRTVRVESRAVAD